MASYLAACRNAVVTRINSGSYVKTVVARSVYSDTVESAINTTNAVDVMCRVVVSNEPDFQTIAGARGPLQAVIPVDIVVAGAVDGKTAANIDSMLEVTEQIADRLWHREAAQLVSGGNTYQFLRTEINPLGDPTSIQERHYAVFSLTAYYTFQKTRGGY